MTGNSGSLPTRGDSGSLPRRGNSGSLLRKGNYAAYRGEEILGDCRGEVFRHPTGER